MAIIKIRNAAIDLDAAEIPNLPASKITSGTFADARIADLSASKLTGSILDARLPANALNSNVDLTNLSASNLTSGTIPTARITALPAGVGGKVLQQVHGSTTTQVSSSSSTLADTTLTATITPSSTSNKILVLVTHNGCYVTNGSSNNALRINLFRGATEIGRTGAVNYFSSTINAITSSASLNVVDSPSSTSALTYKTQFANINGTAEVAVQKTFGGDWGTTSYITLMEIAG